MTHRKRNANAWGEGLSEAQKCAILDKSRRCSSWAEVVDWASIEYSIPKVSRASYYDALAWWREDEHEMQLSLRLQDKAALDRELAAVGTPDAAKIAAVLGNDVAAARARGDENALDRAVRLYKCVASIVKESAELELKAKSEERSAAELALNQDKFQVVVCEKFLAWFADEKARQIAEGAGSNSDKITALRQAYFADVDALEQSGKVNLPT
jgi:hypothetical protein